MLHMVSGVILLTAAGILVLFACVSGYAKIIEFLRENKKYNILYNGPLRNDTQRVLAIHLLDMVLVLWYLLTALFIPQLRSQLKSELICLLSGLLCLYIGVYLVPA